MIHKAHSTLLAFLLLATVACDRIAEDAAPEPPEGGGDEIEYYTLPDQQVAIDLKSISGLSSATTLHITQTPRWGEARFSGTGLLVYTPHETFVAGEDQFAVGAENNSRLSRSFRINMEADSNQIPCNAGPIPDFFRLQENTSIVIDVLKNDHFCSAVVDPSSLAVGQAPKHGTVRAEGGKLVYTPNAGFNGFDWFLYKVAVSNGGKKGNFLAPVKVAVGDPYKDCVITLRDDQVLWKRRLVNDTLRIPVLMNDQLCRSRYDVPITLTKTPEHGKAVVRRSNTVLYIPDADFNGDDGFTYQRCDDGKCLEASVRIRVAEPDPGCVPTARNDVGTIQAARLSDDPQKRFIQIYVLANDRICSPLKRIAINDNPSGADLKVQYDGTVIYRPPGGFTGEVQFGYELTDVKENKSSARVQIIIKE
ncbi:Ig-like domain-containing protein [Larkinella soli]|uniref:Ig-like domain-containing protein n=1 Tax=Larkinella soli TaxID=1770527 RepID=UPI001E39E202|nr:Ig-like domain-containing protein [Larkinella soli]